MDVSGKPDEGHSNVTMTITNVVVYHVLNSVPRSQAVPLAGEAGFVSVITEVKGGAIAVPEGWATNYPGFSAAFGNEFTAALTKTTGKRDASGNALMVWQDYVFGTDPTDPEDVFRASVTIVDGQPKVSWTPELTDEAASRRTYTILGKQKLSDAEWAVVPAGREGEFNFFKVTVEMK